MILNPQKLVKIDWPEAITMSNVNPPRIRYAKRLTL